MPIHTCDYQLIPPTEDYPPAPTASDPVLAALLATETASARGRRFAFCQVIPVDRDSTEVMVKVLYQGIQNPDGTCILMLAGQPYGYYQSIDAAHHHTRRDDLYLSWAEPDRDLPDAIRSVAHIETRENDPSIWLVALPFLAHGPTDARARAIDTATFLEPATPGLTRESAILLSGDNPGTPITLYCPISPCLREPFHHGEHQPKAEDTVEDTEDTAEHTAESEAAVETAAPAGTEASP